MFPPRFHGRFVPSWLGAASRSTGTRRASWPAALLRVAVVPALLALGHPGGASAQALGTMQVQARVLPAKAGWAGLTAATGAARGVLEAPWSGPATRRSGLVQARAELARVDGRRRLLITIHHPRN